MNTRRGLFRIWVDRWIKRGFEVGDTDESKKLIQREIKNLIVGVVIVVSALLLFWL